MRIGETPSVSLKVPGIDLSGKTVLITLEKDPGNVLTFRNSSEQVRVEVDESGTTFYVRLTQENTLALGIGTVTVDIKWIGESGEVKATKQGLFTIKPSLLRRVIVFDGGDDIA